MLAGLGLFGTAAASAETYPVATTAEFEAAVSKANANPGANTIVLASLSYLPKATLTFTNTSGLQTVEGPAGSPTVVGGSAKLSGSSVVPFPSELFVVNAGVSVTFKNVEITGGGGGAVTAVKDSGKTATLGGGTLTIESSLVSGNIGVGVTVEGGATATVRNSTFAEGLSAGLVDDGTASFFNSTVAFNETNGLENAGTLNLTNTIVADNEGGDCAGKATTSDHSLDSDGSCGVGALSNKNPLLTKLTNDGGTTSIFSLKKGSPAIGEGDPAAGVCPATDQRGAKRKSPCSIGADEYSSTPPTISVPAKITTEATGPGGAVVDYAATATGSEDVITSFVCTPASESEFPLGKTTVKCKAEDGHENTATATFEVEVTAKGPAEPPKFSGIPTNITTPATSSSGAMVSYTDPTATDPAGGTDPVTCVPASGSTFPIGATTVTCTATDQADVGAMVTFEVMVTNTPPVFSALANITKEATSSSGAVVTYTNPTATDPAGGTDTVSCVPASGSTFPIGSTTVTCSATSKAGETGTATFEVTITPQQASAVDSIFNLLKEVRTARIQPGIRFELTALLENALASLNGPGGFFPGHGGSPLVAGGSFGQSLEALTAQLTVGREFGCQQALNDLGQFIVVIQADQRTRRRQIPSSLAVAWTSSAQSIETSLSCRTDNHGGSGDGAGGHHGPPGHPFGR